MRDIAPESPEAKFYRFAEIISKTSV